MAERVNTAAAALRAGAIVAIFFLPWRPAIADQASAQPASQQMEQQRLQQAEARKALEASERRVAASQAAQIREAQEQSEQQRRAFAEADRKRQAEQHYEELLVQRRARQSNPPSPPDEDKSQQISPEPLAASLPASVAQPDLRRLRLREAGLVLMTGASLGALLVLVRMVRERLAR